MRRTSPPLAFSFPQPLSPAPAALAVATAVALVALAASPASGQTPPPPRVASFGAGDALEVDLTYDSRWEAMSNIDPLKLQARLRVEVVERADSGAAEPEGTLTLKGRLDVRRVDYERPDRRWSLTPASAPAVPGFPAVMAGLAASARQEAPGYAQRLALAEELLGAATVAARGRPFTIVLPPSGPARVASLDGQPLTQGLPAAAEHVLTGFLAGSARFVLPERGPVVETAVTGPRREVDRGTAEYYQLVGLNPAEAPARTVTGPAKLVTRRVDGLDMRVSGFVPSTKGGRAQVTEAASGSDGRDASLVPFTLLGALGGPQELRPDAVATQPGLAGEQAPGAPDPLDLRLQIRPEQRSVQATGRVVANEALGYTVRRTLRLDESIVGTPRQGSSERVKIESRVTWTANLASVTVARKPKKSAPPRAPAPLVEP